MPFIKTDDLPREFFKYFLDRATDKKIEGDGRLHSMIPIKISEEITKDFMVRYFNKSGEAGTEDLFEYVPCIIIQDFKPELNRSLLFGTSHTTGYYIKESKQLEKIYLPIPMTYRFQVSVITGRNTENYRAQDWFNEEFTFNSPDFFLFNQLETDEGVIGDVVPYILDMQDIPRDDNRFECAYTFSMKAWLHAKAKNYTIGADGVPEGGDFEDTYNQIALSLSVRDLEGYKKLVYENFVVPEDLNF